MTFDSPDAARPGRAPRPRDAATLILVRRDTDSPRILMGRRPASARFMPGKYVFPGGAVDRGDSLMVPASPLKPDDMERLCRGCSPARAQALALAAIRETWEETGLLVGERDPAANAAPRIWRDFAHAQIRPRLDRLTFIARAITPPYRPQRFDARFFLADAGAVAGESARESGELLERVWVDLAQARALDLPNITRRVIDVVAERLEGGATSVPFFRFVRGKPVMEVL